MSSGNSSQQLYLNSVVGQLNNECTSRTNSLTKTTKYIWTSTDVNVDYLKCRKYCYIQNNTKGMCKNCSDTINTSIVNAFNRSIFTVNIALNDIILQQTNILASIDTINTKINNILVSIATIQKAIL